MLKYIIALFVSFMSLCVAADDYVTVNKTGKLFDEPNTKGYVTLNEENQEVQVVPGMAFKVIERRPGWLRVEYAPGITAFISDQLTTINLGTPQPGTYTVSNNPAEKVVITQDGNDWKASVNNKTYPGKAAGNIIVFTDEFQNPAFTLVNLGNNQVVIDYNNSVTKFL